MSRPPGHRFPVAPLLAVSEARERGLSHLAVLISHSPFRSHEWNAVHRRLAPGNGGLTVGLADRYAMALGFHPMEVWGDEWLEGAA